MHAEEDRRQSGAHGKSRRRRGMSGWIHLGDGARHRLSVASRAVAATVGAYAFTSLATTALSYLLLGVFGMIRAEAVLTASLLSFLVFAVAAMTVFRARTARRAWIGLALATAPFALVVLSMTNGATV